eukprot:scaffold442_cov268-Pinguiococcus_pyrenoidosus.AAC.31
MPIIVKLGIELGYGIEFALGGVLCISSAMALPFCSFPNIYSCKLLVADLGAFASPIACSLPSPCSLRTVSQCWSRMIMGNPTWARWTFSCPVCPFPQWLSLSLGFGCFRLPRQSAFDSFESAKATGRFCRTARFHDLKIIFVLFFFPGIVQNIEDLRRFFDHGLDPIHCRHGEACTGICPTEGHRNSSVGLSSASRLVLGPEEDPRSNVGGAIAQAARTIPFDIVPR